MTDVERDAWIDLRTAEILQDEMVPEGRITDVLLCPTTDAEDHALGLALELALHCASHPLTVREYALRAALEAVARSMAVDEATAIEEAEKQRPWIYMDPQK